MADEAKPWEPPTTDQEFVFESAESVPNWIDKSFASWSNGPALALPAGDVFAEGPYTTITARVGDTVYFKAATPSKYAHFEVIEGEPMPGSEGFTARPPQATNASLEDMIKTGWLAPDDLGSDAKGQVIARSPKLKSMIEEGRGAPEPVTVSEVLKIS